MCKKIKLISKTLDNLIMEQNINVNNFDHLIIDVQGAELEVLKGSLKFLKKCKTIYIEVSTAKFYESGSQWNDIKNFLNNSNFQEIREPMKNHDDIIFKKMNANNI